MKDLKHANNLYNKKIAEEKRVKAANEKAEREKRNAAERKAIDARKAERARKKEERDAQKAIQQAQKGKRKASQEQGARKKQNCGAVAARSRAPAHEPPLEPPPTHSNRGRKIIRPRKFW